MDGLWAAPLTSVFRAACNEFRGRCKFHAEVDRDFKNWPSPTPKNRSTPLDAMEKARRLCKMQDLLLQLQSALLPLCSHVTGDFVASGFAPQYHFPLFPSRSRSCRVRSPDPHG